MVREFDIELAIAAVKFRLYRDYFDRRTQLWCSLPLLRPQTNATLAATLDRVQDWPDSEVTIDSTWVGDLFTNPYGLVGCRRASERVAKLALKICVAEELQHQLSTTLFMSAMDRLAGKNYDNVSKRLQVFRDHYGAVFRELLRFAPIAIPNGYDPDEDDALEVAEVFDSSESALGIAGPGLSIDGAALLAQYYGLLSHLESEAKIKNRRKLGWHTQIAMSTSVYLWRTVKSITPGTVPLPLLRLYLLQSLCNELSNRAEMVAAEEGHVTALAERVRETNYFAELDWLLGVCPWRYDETRTGLIVAWTLRNHGYLQYVQKYAIAVLECMDKIMIKVNGTDGFDCDHPVFHFREAILNGYEILCEERTLQLYMKEHDRFRSMFVAIRNAKIARQRKIKNDT
jgi:hypothetical protein